LEVRQAENHLSAFRHLYCARLQKASRQVAGRNQLGRRNLNPKAAAILRAKLYNAKKKTKSEAGAKARTSKPQNAVCSQNSAAEVAAQTGVSKATVERDAQFLATSETLAHHSRSGWDVERDAQAKKEAAQFKAGNNANADGVNQHDRTVTPKSGEPAQASYSRKMRSIDVLPK